ncbi:MAG: asparagine synthase (glutamine-hydrolyzing) [Thalassobaculaceae bacterium]|nr:asparagine synthase (glutamine-hydrolyzing) [Thalassobaculaceae bacterium]
MCGICGIIGRRADQETVDRMVAAMHHRGPDDRGTSLHPGVAVGMTRLAIQDLGPGGHQPMAAPEKDVWIVYNGEMYNAPEQRAHLEQLGYSFRSTSDTEVILTLYRHYGSSCVQRIRGIFAFAVVDLRENPGEPVVFLARDPLGVKPLLFARTSEGAVFASELKSMVASGIVPPEINPRALAALFRHGAVFQPDTMINGVFSIPPAHFVRVQGEKVAVERYWRLGVDRVQGLRQADYGDQVAAMDAALRETVKAQMIGDVPVGAFLSGGVDSATLTALMAAEAGARVKTFSVGFQPELAIIDETELSGEFAAHLGTDHTRIEITPEQIRNDIDRIVDGIDQPSIDGLNTYFVSKAAGADVKVALSGTGADDLFMGYPWHARMLRHHADAPNFLDAFAECNGRFHQTFDPGDIGHLIHPLLARRRPMGKGVTYAAIDELHGADPIARMTALTLRGYTNNQLLRDIDAMSMAHSLEVRVPYLDPHVIDVGLSLPQDAILARGAPLNPMKDSYQESGIKRILIDVARPLLPKGFDDVPKRGFAMPLGIWLNGPLKDLVLDVLRPERVAKTGVMHPGTMTHLPQLFDQNRPMFGWRLWLMMITQIWAERMGVEPAG